MIHRHRFAHCPHSLTPLLRVTLVYQVRLNGVEFVSSWCRQDDFEDPMKMDERHSSRRDNIAAVGEWRSECQALSFSFSVSLSLSLSLSSSLSVSVCVSVSLSLSLSLSLS